MKNQKKNFYCALSILFFANASMLWGQPRDNDSVSSVKLSFDSTLHLKVVSIFGGKLKLNFNWGPEKSLEIKTLKKSRIDSANSQVPNHVNAGSHHSGLSDSLAGSPVRANTENGVMQSFSLVLDSTYSEFFFSFTRIEPGSLKVTANGIPLREHIDYVLNYDLGKLTLLRPGLASSGQELKVIYNNLPRLPDNKPGD